MNRFLSWGLALGAAAVFCACGGSAVTNGGGDGGAPNSDASPYDAPVPDGSRDASTDATIDAANDAPSDAPEAPDGLVTFDSGGFVCEGPQLFPPTFDPPGGPVPVGTEVTITCPDLPMTGNAGIFYTTDGTLPVRGGSSLVYAGPIPITADTTLHALCSDLADCFADSMVSTGAYTVVPGTPESGPPEACAPGATTVYAISDANVLYSFDPPSLKFTMIGPVTCAGESLPASTPRSLAVDRSANAYVNFSSGHICKCPTTAPVDCQPTSFVPGQAGFSAALGMAFSSNPAGSPGEALFVSDESGEAKAGSGKGLGLLDVNTMTLTPIGGYTGNAAGYDAELTGTGDGRLFGLFTTVPATFDEIAKNTGATPLPVPLASVNNNSGAYAITFWGGDFWLFTASSTPPGGSLVTHYSMFTNAAEVVVQNAGFTVAGAGVSTCAPLTSR
jgi:hypothetical protein